MRGWQQIKMTKYLLSNDSPDNAIMVEHTTYKVENIVIQEDQRWIICSRFKSEGPFFRYPMNSCELDIYLVKDTERQLTHFQPQDIDSKVVLLPYRNKYVSIPLIESK
mgnify:CR=1